MALRDTFFGTPTRTVLTVGGAAALVWLVLNRKKVGEVAMSTATSAQLAATRLLMPKGTEYLADLAFELAPQYDVSPFTILGITYAESTFGRALRPAGPEGTGDFIPRRPGRVLYHNNKKITLQELVDIIGFPYRVGNTPEECSYMSGGKRVFVSKTPPCLIPTARGWGHGLYQLDLQSHAPFIATGKWADPREAMIYALKLYSTYRSSIKKAVPSLGPIDLLRASIAAYNAGDDNVIAALRKGVPVSELDKGLNKVTYSEGYVEKILGKAQSFAPVG